MKEESDSYSLATLVGMPRERFVERYWPRRAFVAHGAVSRFEHLADVPELGDAEALLRASERAADRVRVWFLDRETGAHLSVKVDAMQALALYRSGQVTVVVDSLSTDPIKRWLSRLSNDLETPMTGSSCNVYASTRGVGTVFHFDQCEVILVQLRGKKRWRVAPSTVPNVAVGYFPGVRKSLELLGVPADAMKPDLAKAKNYELRPGSVMFLPRGYWHSSDTSAGESLAVTLTLNAHTWASLLGGYITKKLSREAGFSGVAEGALPWNTKSGRSEAHFRDVLAAAIRDLETLDLDRCVEAAAGIYSVLPAVRLRIAPGLRCRLTAARELHIEGPGGRQAFALDRTTATFWRAISKQKGAFTPRDVATPSAPAEALGRFLERLLEAGVLVSGGRT